MQVGVCPVGCRMCSPGWDVTSKGAQKAEDAELSPRHPLIALKTVEAQVGFRGHPGRVLPA